MALQSVCGSHLHSNHSLNKIGNTKCSLRSPFSSLTVSAASISRDENSGNDTGWRIRRFRTGDALKCQEVPNFLFEKLHKRKNAIFYLPNADTGTAARTSDFGKDSTMEAFNKITNGEVPGKRDFDERELFRGKSGSVSFCGLTHQLVEEGNLESSPFKEGTGSFVWVLGPIAFISSFLLPQFFLLNSIEAILMDEIVTGIVVSFCSEAMFYAGLATFLLVADHVQRPYLQFSPKRWGLITGLRGYLTTAFFIMGFKVFAPLLALYVVWPVIGLPAVVAVAPFLLGCGAQLLFEANLDKRRSSCWPLVPIIFEVYRLYQLTRGAHLIERLMLQMKGSIVTPELVEKSTALLSMLVVFQVLAVVCLWSLMTFLLRLFPSRPVADNY